MTTVAQTPPAASAGDLVPRASARDSAGVVADVVAPLLARGVIVRRPRVVSALDRLDADRRAVRRLQLLRDRYGDGPVRLAMPPGREMAFVLAPADVHRVLFESPDPFTPASREKRAALGHFQPHGVLVTSDNAARAERRRFNEEVLDTGRPVHAHAAAITRKIEDEVHAMITAADDTLTWHDFAPAWWRMVRRITLGDGAADDHDVTDMLTRLRLDANWAFMHPRRDSLRQRFLDKLTAYVEHAEPGSLAELVAARLAEPGTDPVGQIPQWLFAFDAAGMTALRALALLDAHDHARESDHSFLRATILETVRLWPTTPAILRDTTRPTTWANGTLNPGTGLVIFTPFFHRDDQRLPYANSFAPEIWDGGHAKPDWPLVPFSEGAGECPGRNLVLLTTSTLLATLIDAAAPHAAAGQRLDPTRPLPATLSPFRLRFTIRAN